MPQAYIRSSCGMCKSYMSSRLTMTTRCLTSMGLILLSYTPSNQIYSFCCHFYFSSKRLTSTIWNHRACTRLWWGCLQIRNHILTWSKRSSWTWSQGMNYQLRWFCRTFWNLLVCQRWLGMWPWKITSEEVNVIRHGSKLEKFPKSENNMWHEKSICILIQGIRWEQIPQGTVPKTGTRMRGRIIHPTWLSHMHCIMELYTASAKLYSRNEWKLAKKPRLVYVYVLSVSCLFLSSFLSCFLSFSSLLILAFFPSLSFFFPFIFFHVLSFFLNENILWRYYGATSETPEAIMEPGSESEAICRKS